MELYIGRIDDDLVSCFDCAGHFDARVELVAMESDTGLSLVRLFFSAN